MRTTNQLAWEHVLAVLDDDVLRRVALNTMSLHGLPPTPPPWNRAETFDAIAHGLTAAEDFLEYNYKNGPQKRTAAQRLARVRRAIEERLGK